MTSNENSFINPLRQVLKRILRPKSSTILVNDIATRNIISKMMHLHFHCKTTVFWQISICWKVSCSQRILQTNITNSKQQTSSMCIQFFVLCWIDFGSIWHSKSITISCKSRLIKQDKNRCKGIREKTIGHLRNTPLRIIGPPNFRSRSIGGGEGGTTNNHLHKV